MPKNRNIIFLLCLGACAFLATGCAPMSSREVAGIIGLAALLAPFFLLAALVHRLATLVVASLRIVLFLPFIVLFAPFILLGRVFPRLAIFGYTCLRIISASLQHPGRSLDINTDAGEVIVR